MVLSVATGSVLGLGLGLGAVVAVTRGSNPAPSLTRISPAFASNTFANTAAGSARWRTNAFDQFVWPGGR